jgi:predicted RNA binding protein with dsRBD fold (UPF0201 family)
MMAAIRITCPIFPSEDPERVRQAVLNIFPGAMLNVTDEMMTADDPSMEHFSDKIRKQRILDATRSVMMKGRRGSGRTSFNMNKQAAYVGKISFVEERTILGTIRVTIDADDITAFIESFAPQTVDGEEVRI